MNNICRENITERKLVRDKNGEIKRVETFSYIRRYKSIGFSKMITAVARFDGRNGIKSGDKVYFKVNNNRGYSIVGRTDESSGSCEDIAEVLGFYVLRDLEEKLGDKAILKGTPYDFAEGESLEYESTRTSQFSYDDGRLYGCISKDAVKNNGIILHGNDLLSLCKQNGGNTKNTIFNYAQALEIFEKEYSKNGKKIMIDPSSIRNLTNLMFFDYFFIDSDRHSKNICFENFLLKDGTEVLTPLSVLDNGGGLAMQHPNCKSLYNSQYEILVRDGKFEKSSQLTENQFDTSYSLFVGGEMFEDKALAKEFDNLPYEYQLVALIGKNRILFNDFKNLYENIDFEKCLRQMKNELGFAVNFNKNNDGNGELIPHFNDVLKGLLTFKKREISVAMASALEEEFDEEKFNSNQSYYLDKFEKIVKENELNLHIATDSEIREFNEKFLGRVSQRGE